MQGGVQFCSAEYRAWTAMRQRVKGIGGTHYKKHYVERGITMDPAWADFFIFLADMGAHPGPGYSLDRRDNNAGYSKSNCRWATPKQQQRNTRVNVLTEKDIPEIRRLAKAGVRYAKISQQFGLSGSGYVSRIVREIIWKPENMQRLG